MNMKTISDTLMQWVIKALISSVIFGSVVMISGLIITLTLPSSQELLSSQQKVVPPFANKWEYLTEHITTTMHTIGIHPETLPIDFSVLL
ncbi:MAG: hypothetical protein LBP53_02180 [Candidatus Peribacteria bacterium]|jgi:hypothetical protein|nr:hypothetical protein [Candidatus Peribacteria bacterium]